MQVNEITIDGVIKQAFKELTVFKDHRSFDSMLWTLTMLGIVAQEDYKFWCRHGYC